MNLNKHYDFFNPENLVQEIHIIGVGAVGSCIAEQLARLGVEKIHIHDFDIVSEHNITNQMYLANQIGKPKTEALTEILKSINPDIQVSCHGEWTQETPLSGHVFLAVDNIELRKEILNANKYNPNITTVYDCRMGLTDAQAYAAKWNETGKEFLLSTMNFTSEEAKANVPISACGTALNVTPTVRIITSLVVANYINVVLGKPITKTILIDAFKMTLDAFDDNGARE